MKIINIKIIRNNINNFSLPQHITPGSAGLDLLACIEKPVSILPKETRLIPTGIAIYIEDIEVAGIILPRSGLGHYYGIVLGNTIGLIDSDYQGEIMISLWNRGSNKFILYPGKRIAQLLFISILRVKLSLVKSFDPFMKTIRGVKGFGHSM
ncbi:deoxyuridine 5'-triphosphate nucleotidohydrolase [Candidatus Blochmanniella floridana]|uniref:Deoxyuridine 5'-triphosphate nucleotidohydrolase n=1 Tax=Blochmanniella floridana TaxID=203907 RepID=DUT_BLOFL|nr:RecName: Full=Deoxyuridine 5'-triphosphate nucleotidohydrolase; Short=dUTPase; AltName: Full=dUTP pyrophosphatase [Candidatus Blochmannia floridanus]CAD83288.1 deoxyuridine 5'-triphosphate nucleotidohydrolase [Candidatus Blochmannia floridanus]